jgi:hypothetical protein
MRYMQAAVDLILARAFRKGQWSALFAEMERPNRERRCKADPSLISFCTCWIDMGSEW